MQIWKKSGSNTNYNSTVWSAIKSGTPVHLSIYFSDSGIRIEDQDVSLDSGLALNDIFNGDIDLVFGKFLNLHSSILLHLYIYLFLLCILYAILAIILVGINLVKNIPAFI